MPVTGQENRIVGALLAKQRVQPVAFFREVGPAFKIMCIGDDLSRGNDEA